MSLTGDKIKSGNLQGIIKIELGLFQVGTENVSYAGTGKKIRSSELAFAAPGLYPPQVLRQNRCYYESGAVATGQAART